MYTQIQEIGGKGGPVNLKGNPDGTLVIGYQRPLFDLRAKDSGGEVTEIAHEVEQSGTNLRSIRISQTTNTPNFVNAYRPGHSGATAALAGKVYVVYGGIRTGPTTASELIFYEEGSESKTYTVSQTAAGGSYAHWYQVEGLTYDDVVVGRSYFINIEYSNGSKQFLKRDLDTIYDDNDGRIAWTIKEDTPLIPKDPKDSGSDLPVRHSMSGKVIVTAIYASEAVRDGAHAPWGIVSGNQETSVRARWPGEEPVTFHIRSNAGLFWVPGAEMIEIANTPVSSILCCGSKRS